VRAAKHGVLPHHDAVLITEVVKLLSLRRIKTSSQNNTLLLNADAVEVAVL
jgi:hypothetical protein